MTPHYSLGKKSFAYIPKINTYYLMVELQINYYFLTLEIIL